MTLISLLVVLVVIFLLWWALNSLMSAFGVGDPIATVIRVIFVVAVILWLLAQFGVGVPGVRLR